MEPEVLRFDCVVVGSGVAGLRAAIEAARHGTVAVVTKGAAEEGNTQRAQGGIAVAMAEGDDPALHMRDTLEAGAGLCDEAAVRVLVEEGIDRVRELIHWGARFDREGGELSFTKEGAHRIRRIIHAMGDATGLEVERTLLRIARGQSRITFFERTLATGLVVEDGRCVGVACLAPGSLLVLGRGVVLAAGGFGYLYKETTNPPLATGDGFIMAYDAGAELQDLEFVQFHPTVLVTEDAPPFLISEAVRGEGAVLRNARGEAFMKDYHPMGDLAPRDVACRAIFDQMYRTHSPCVYLDVTGLPLSVIETRFPNIMEQCLARGIDISRDWVPVRPAAHFVMGGVKVDLEGASAVPGLYACGEVASCGVHGANRLASNSLLEGLVWGKRCGERVPLLDPPPPAVREYAHAFPSGALRGSEDETLAERLRTIMTEKVGIIRCAASLSEALEAVQRELGRFEDGQASVGEGIRKMYRLARLVIEAALRREESRGAHYRTDYPVPRDEWLTHVVLRKGVGYG